METGRGQAGKERGAGDSARKDVVVEGFSINVGGKELFRDADLRCSPPAYNPPPLFSLLPKSLELSHPQSLPLFPR